MAARLGFEPRQTESESVVLPLHNRAVSVGNSFIIIARLPADVNIFSEIFQVFSQKILEPSLVEGPATSTTVNLSPATRNRTSAPPKAKP